MAKIWGRARIRETLADPAPVDALHLSAESLRLAGTARPGAPAAAPPPSIIPVLPAQPTTPPVTLAIVVTKDSATPNMVVSSSTTIYGNVFGSMVGMWDGPATSFVNNGTLWNEYDWGSVALSINGAVASTNNGAIVARAFEGGADAYAIMLNTATLNLQSVFAGPVVNNGQIWAVSAGGDASAIYSSSGFDVIQNNGLLAAKATTDPEEPYDSWAPRWTGNAFTINMREAWSRIVNSATGTILAEGDRAVAIWTRGGPPAQAPAWAVDNAGLIKAVSTEAGTDSIGIELSDNSGWISRVRNSGTIEADTAILAPSTGWEGFFNIQAYGVEEILNTATGVIRGRIELHNGNDKVTNEGLIVGAIEMGPGEDLVTNSGTIDGIVYLGTGDDQFIGGAGADHVLGERDNDRLNGGGGDDLLLGGVGDDVIEGGLGNDGLYGEFGNDRLVTLGGDTAWGGDGDDRIELGDYEFRGIAGGAGFDTLVLPGGPRSLDLGAILATGRISGIEAIVLGGGKELVVRAIDVPMITGGGTELVVSASGTDVIDLAGTWTEGGTRAIDGQTYRSFTSAASTIWVQQGATVHLGAAPAAGLDMIADGAAPPLPDASTGIALDSGYTLILDNFDPAGGVYRPGGVSVRVEAYEVWESVNGAQAVWNDTQINIPPTVTTLDNYGTLLATGDWSWSRPVLLYSGVTNNYGTIWADNPRGLAEGVLAGASRSFVNNYGQIIATAGLGTAIGIESYGVPERDEPDVYNEGLIHAESEHGYAIGIYGSNIGSVITNNGTIEVHGGDGSMGVDLGNSPGIFYNNGEVYASVTPDSEHFAIGHASAGGTLINTGLISAEIAVYFMFHQFYQINLDNQGVLDGEIYVGTTRAGALVGHGWITNSGTIHGGLTWDPAYLTEDTVTNTGTIDGDLWMAGGNDRFTGTGGIQSGTIYGEGGDDILIGGAGADRLNGGLGADILEGGAGADIFLYSIVADSTAAATDRLRAFQSGLDRIDLLALAPGQISWVQQTDTSDNSLYNLVTAITASGNLVLRVDGALSLSDFLIEPGRNLLGTPAGGDMLVGDAGNDTLDGRGGADVMRGLGGNDTYIVDDFFDQVIEASGEGNDAVYAEVSYQLGGGQSVETLAARNNASTAAMDLFGNAFANTIFGSNGANFLDGAAGADILTGFGGNDIYAVDNAGDVVIEDNGQGNDAIYTTFSYILGFGSSVETLASRDNSLTVAMDLFGNELANVIFGNNGANFLDGLTGADIMTGFGGNDIYAVDNAGDVVIEENGQGNDAIYTTFSYILGFGSSVELLASRDNSLTTAMNLFGNELNNTILGNNGANYLDGLTGADVMAGYSGDDTYIIDNAGDVVVEEAGRGSDAVYTSLSFVLSAGSSVETIGARDNSLTMALNLTGNELGNGLLGNNGANVLDGKGGADTLLGFAGADTFAFTTAIGTGTGNVDLIADFVSGTDRIALDDAIFTGLAPGALSAGAFVTGTAAADADDRIVYDAATGKLYFDADGNGAGAAILFATLQGNPALAASDFMVI